MTGQDIPPLLQVSNLSMSFGGLAALCDICFNAERGQITAIIGPNGAGKTTLFNCITGFYHPGAGRMCLTHKNGQQFSLCGMPDHSITRKARIARTFQNIRLFPGMTALENLLVARHHSLMRASRWSIGGLLGTASWKKAEKEAIEQAMFWLEKVNLADSADDVAGSLSYGDQRRLEIVRALSTEPELLCLDEPAAGLNPRESELLNLLLFDIRQRTGIGILLIEHDMNVVMNISDHIIVLDHGRLIATGDPAGILSNNLVINAYLGRPEEETGNAVS